ncbi:arsenate reductase (glutaredoxin) [bacterium]|nr:arsenate reductase (glutaredoxin) [bacterium]
MGKSMIWHNPRCSKSRTALELLNSKDLDLDVVKYLETAPDRQQIEKVLALLNLEPRDLMRKTEAVYTKLDLHDPSLGRDELIDAMVENPILIERPVFVHNGRAVIGRPPESVLTLLEE